jgi:hypothetical protein
MRLGSGSRSEAALWQAAEERSLKGKAQGT